MFRQSRDFIFAWDNNQGGVALHTDINKVNMQKKCLLIVKTDPSAPFQKDIEACTNIIARIVFMEFSKPILESLHYLSSVSLPYILSSCHAAYYATDLAFSLT